MNPVLLESGKKIAVIALGGNAILRKGQDASPQTQLANIRRAISSIEGGLAMYSAFALTHGNGPQVGNDLIRSLAGAEYEGLPELDLVDCVANTQGRIGHWLIHEMKRNPAFTERKTACVLTHVYVNKDTFKPDEYTKYVGPWRRNDPETRARFDSRGIIYKSPAGSEESIRRVVPSPEPYAIEEIEIIDSLLQREVITICCGGGGIPVYNPSYKGNLNGSAKGTEKFRRSEVVIDKDRASSVLAISLYERNPTIEVHLIILADCKGLYKTPELREEDFIADMSYDELNEFREVSELDPGSIGPKVEAIYDFLAAGGRDAYLGPLDDFPQIFDPSSRVGTHFHRTQQLDMFGKKGK